MSTPDGSPPARQKPPHGKFVSLDALRDFWHPVAFANEVTTAPYPVRLLETQVIVYRTEEGDLGCLADLCIHRGTPLSLGAVDGANLVCAYHGWAYDRGGVCVRIPAIPAERPIPSKARVPAYQVTERYGLVWVCLGTPQAPIADFPEYGDDTFHAFLVDAEDWQASGARLIENFIDTAHFAWIHPGLLGRRDQPLTPPITVTQHADRMEVDFEMEVNNAIHKGATSHVWDEVTIPFTVRQVRTDPSGGSQVVFLAICPTSATTLRRFAYKLRNYDLDAPDEPFIEKSRIVAEQDRAIVERQRPEELPVDLADEMHVRGPDDPAVLYRRMLTKVGIDAQ